MRVALAYRAALTEHPNALPLILERSPATPAALRVVEVLVGILRQGGLGPAEALAGMNAICAAVRGAAALTPQSQSAPSDATVDAALDALAPEEFPYLLEALPWAREFFAGGFEFGVRALARGLPRSTRERPRNSDSQFRLQDADRLVHCAAVLQADKRLRLRPRTQDRIKCCKLFAFWLSTMTAGTA